MGYTKLFSSIVTSTIWDESNQTRIVWITLLASADKNGEIQATIPGLAHAARVTIPECETALSLFMSPDAYSRSTDDAGRRIEKIEGGWALLNHAKYRAMASKGDAKEANAARQTRFKSKKARNKSNALATVGNAFVAKSNAKEGQGNASVTHDRDIAEAEAEAEAENTGPHDSSIPPDCPDEIVVTDMDIYRAYPRRQGPKAALKAIANARKAGNTSESLLAAATAYATATALWSQPDKVFIPHPATWFNRGSFSDDPSEWVRRSTSSDVGGKVSSFA